MCSKQKAPPTEDLHWKTDGFVLYDERLEQGTFTPPAMATENSPISWSQPVLMIEGI
ncbi:MAG: IS66 family insertion sequence element accessory protein TnpB [Acidobacterium ailaaui]|nr:IS66 family insertion sequence element accessory protein TnpB [Pseudacidobacterium ailaaui]